MFQFLQQQSPRSEPTQAAALAPRITGLEAEHAILFRPREHGGPAPTRREIYDLIEERLTLRGPTLRSGLIKPGIFLANSGLVQHEALPSRDTEGLLEIASPECRDPRDSALYHRVLENQVAAVIPEVEKILARQGTPGSVALGKNCTDYKGNYYGAHENYDAADPLPPVLRPLIGLYVGLVWLPSALPIALGILTVLAILSVSLLLTVATGLLSLLSLLPLIGYRIRRARQAITRFTRQLGSRVASAMQWLLDNVAMRMTVWWNRYLIGCLRPVFLRRFQRDLPGFLVTRVMFSGSGSISDEGELHLSQRAPIIGSVAGIFLNDGKRPILDLRDLYWPPHAAMARRKRLHIMVGDSNMSDVVNYLKLGTTQLVLDMIEAGRELPGTQIADPVAALQTISEGGGRDVTVLLVDGSESTALQVQRRYLEAAEQHFAPAATAGAEDPGAERVCDLMRRWRATLDGLEANPHVLYRELDWVCKSDVIAQSEDRAALPGILTPDHLERHRKIDLRYHEIGPDGYYEQLAAEGQVTRIFSEDELARASISPPSGTRAQARGALVSMYGHHAGDIVAGWSRVAGSDPVTLDVYLEDPYHTGLPAELPPPPAPDDSTGPKLDRVATQLPILPGGTGRASSAVTGVQVPFLLLLFLADLAVAFSLPTGGAALAVGLLGFVIMAPLVSVSLASLLRQLLGKGAFDLEDVAAASMNVGIVNLAVAVVCRLIFGMPAIW